MSVRSKEFVLVAAVFALVFAIPIGHTLWTRYQKKLDQNAQMGVQSRSRQWAIEILEQSYDDPSQKKPFPSQAYWETWMRKHADAHYRADCRRLGTHIALNRELCGRKLW